MSDIVKSSFLSCWTKVEGAEGVKAGAERSGFQP